MIDPFLKLKYGNIVELDVHNKTLEEARSELLYALDLVDIDVDAILVVHGFHKGTVIKDYVRKKFSDRRVIKKVNPDAGATLLILSEDKTKK